MSLLFFKNSHPIKPWLIISIASLFFFYNFLQMNMLDVLGQYFATRFHLSSAVSLGNFSSLFLYANVIFFLPAGLILDKYSTRIILICASILYFSSVFLLLCSSNLLEAETARVLSGIAGSFSFLSCVKLANQWISKKHIGKAISFCATFGFSGGLVANYPLSIFYNHFGVRSFLLLNFFLGIIIFLLIVFIVEDKKAEQQIMNQVKNSIVKNFVEVCKKQINWSIGLYMGLLNLPIMLLGALWGIGYLQQVDSVSSEGAASIVGMIFLGSIFGMPFFGWLTDFMKNRKKPMIIGAMLSLTAIFFIIYAGKNCQPFILTSLFFLLGFFTSAQVVGFPVMTDLNRPYQIAAATALSAIVDYICGGFSQVLFGWILQIFSKSLPLTCYSRASYSSAILILPVAFFVALLLAVFIKESFPLSQVFASGNSKQPNAK